MSPTPKNGEQYTMKHNDQFSFLEHRRTQEKEHFAKFSDFNPLQSILTVEVNTTELCNRKCVFCPRHDPRVFPNRNLHMTPKGAERIAKELCRNHYRGKISLSGFGENLLNPEFPQIVNWFKTFCSDSIIECNTNGDRLSPEYAKNLFENGLTLLYINLYDGAHQMQHFDKVMQDIPPEKYKYRMHWSMKDHGLILNNRSGVIDWIGIEESDIKSLKGKVCHYPFYKMFIDWNGDVLFCSNDWGREHVIGNMLNNDLMDIWFGKPMRKIRARLAKGDRSHSPCNKCSVNGQLFGKKSFDIVQKYEEDNNNRKSRAS